MCNWKNPIGSKMGGMCSPSVKTIKIEDFPNATLFLLQPHNQKQLVPALHCSRNQQRDHPPLFSIPSRFSYRVFAESAFAQSVDVTCALCERVEAPDDQAEATNAV